MNVWIIVALLAGIGLGIFGVVFYFIWVFTDGFKNLGPGG